MSIMQPSTAPQLLIDQSRTGVSDFGYRMFVKMLVSVVSCMDSMHGFDKWIRCMDSVHGFSAEAMARRSKKQ